MTDTIAFLSTPTQFVYTRIAGQSMGKWQYVFLTLVLVSGIFAAGCLGEDTSVPVPAAIKPQGNLQSGQVLQVFGDVTGLGIPRGTVDTITFTVSLVPEIKSMDMEKLVIVYADAIRTETLSPIEGFRGNPSPGDWGILSVQNEVGNPNNRIEYEEQFVIRINPKAPIVPNQVITIILKPQNGTPTSIRRITPTTIMAENLLPPI
jgi:archaellin